MKANITSQFLLVIVMLFLTMIILSTAFGEGIVGNVIGFFGQSNPSYLAEEFSLLTTVVSNAPGDMKAGIKIKTERNIHIDSENVYVMSISNSYLKPSYIIFDETEIKGKGIIYINKIDNQLSVTLEGIE